MSTAGPSAGSDDGSEPTTGDEPNAEDEPGPDDGGPPSLCSPAPCETFYVSPDGSDTADGRTPDRAVATLARVQSLLAAKKTLEKSHVEVRIAPGEYLGQKVVWKVSDAAHTLTFLPAAHRFGTPFSGKRPVFDGQRHEGYFFYASISAGRRSNIRLVGLEVRNYVVGGIAFVGKPDYGPTTWNGSNLVSSCRFVDIGNRLGGAKDGYAGVSLYDTRDSEVSDNEFVRLENVPATGELMHGIYLAHGSTENLVARNRFDRVTGDAIRARNGANFNRVFDNTTTRAGVGAFYDDWYCDATWNTACTRQECPSWGNEVKRNEVGCAYDGKAVLLFEYHQGERYDRSTANVPPGCPDHFTKGWRRLTTASNVLSCK